MGSAREVADSKSGRMIPCGTHAYSALSTVGPGVTRPHGARGASCARERNAARRKKSRFGPKLAPSRASLEFFLRCSLRTCKLVLQHKTFWPRGSEIAQIARRPSFGHAAWKITDVSTREVFSRSTETSHVCRRQACMRGEHHRVLALPESSMESSARPPLHTLSWRLGPSQLACILRSDSSSVTGDSDGTNTPCWT